MFCKSVFSITKLVAMLQFVKEEQYVKKLKLDLMDKLILVNYEVVTCMRCMLFILTVCSNDRK